ncbi:hypothetical protein J1P26_25010 [Neobacillus sp. MM2021_6]|uniref:hypothetical protein n=1 Tax=Bacillaceae TaxID=186817 RepID=UPI001408689F|nr:MULTISPECIES: hypothetical protein [Bacillaceae]MBO0962936.1 hypothetical protein [Neobacillus sp. MM2021_6]NHC21214.1 hypothetical protein [Bacillus sp. MM2020_4]
MKIQIASVNISYSPEGEVVSVQVFFQGYDEERTININGYLPLTAGEYSGNESITALTNIVKNSVSSRLLD